MVRSKHRFSNKHESFNNHSRRRSKSHRFNFNNNRTETEQKQFNKPVTRKSFVSKNKTTTHKSKSFSFYLIKEYIKKYGWFTLILLLIFGVILGTTKTTYVFINWLNSIVFFLFVINITSLLLVYLLKPFKWINSFDLSDDLKYYFTKILSVLVFIGLIIFFIIFGSFFIATLTIQHNFLDKINSVLYTIFFFGAGIWILCIAAFLGLRQRRRANGIFIWNK